MVQKNIGRAALLIFAFAMLSMTGHAETLEVVLGETDGWRDLSALAGVSLRPGKRGFLDVRLEDRALRVDEHTDLLVDFDTGIDDLAGHYELRDSAARIHPQAARRGGGGGVFEGNEIGVVYLPSDGALLAPYGTWNDLSIEFWLYPALLDEGSTVLSWHGAHVVGDQTRIETIEATLSNRTLVWSFDNVFLTGDLSDFRIELEGNRKLLPKRWHHHLFRYDGDTGLAEYLIDGEVVDITHTTPSRREEPTVYAGFTGNSANTELRIGSGLTGFIDDLRIRTDFVESPDSGRFADRGTLTTRVFDLDYSNSAIVSLDADYAEPGNSALLFYYRIGDSLAAPTSVIGAWRPLLPGTPFGDELRGRYLQFHLEFYPDGTGNESPTLHTMRFSYEPDLPPHPPERLRAEPADGSVSLTWNRSLDPDVAGYLVYYGTEELRYFGDSAAEGVSPVDVGNTDRVTLTGLENGSLYYFSVVAYDSSIPPHQSEFAEQVSARPTRVLGTR